MVERIADLNCLKVDCSAFTPVKNVADLKLAAPTPGLRSEFLFADEDGHTYEGPTPYMVQRNALGFLQRENGIAQARKRGYRWSRRGSAESGIAVVS